MVKEGEKEWRQGKSEDMTPGVTQPQFPSISAFGIPFKYMEATYMQRGTLCCGGGQTLANYVNKIIYHGSNTTLGAAGSVS